MITAEYFAPSKELLSEELSLPVAFSELSVSLKPTVTGLIRFLAAEN